jgi:2-polyprenyl-3-methyl-5-hydroxy-6-metoxy-1,4-benzoquinol methylase
MDDPQLPEDIHLDALKGLARLNRVTGVAPAMYRRLRRLTLAAGRPLKVLDIATGSGDMPIYWAKRARRECIDLHCTGLDISPIAVKVAEEAAAAERLDVQFLQRDVLADRLPSGYDVLTCGLFIHHLHEPQIVRLLQSMQSAANLALLICDLERSYLNLACVWFASHVLSRSEIVHRDGVRSVRAALTRNEFQQIASRALCRPIRVNGLPPCRFIATIEEAVIKLPKVALVGVQTT